MLCFLNSSIISSGGMLTRASCSRIVFSRRWISSCVHMNESMVSKFLNLSHQFVFMSDSICSCMSMPHSPKRSVISSSVHSVVIFDHCPCSLISKFFSSISILSFQIITHKYIGTFFYIINPSNFCFMILMPLQILITIFTIRTIVILIKK